VYEEALSLYRQVGSVQGEASCIEGLGDIALRRSDHEQARQRYEEALPLYEHIQEPYSIGLTHRHLARIALDENERNRRVQAARHAWQRIECPTLLKELDDSARPRRAPPVLSSFAFGKIPKSQLLEPF
jgi:tetratricopeptide (TPR) repeat protein